MRDTPSSRQRQPRDRLVSWLQLLWVVWGIAWWTVLVGMAGMAADRPAAWVALGLVWPVGAGLLVLLAWSPRGAARRQRRSDRAGR
jgi:hypothetical protein